MLNIFFVLAFIIDIVEKLKNKYMIWDSTYISFQGLLILRKYAETTNLTIIERHIIRTKVTSLLKFTKIYVKNFTFNHHPFRKSNASQTLQSRIQVRGELVGMENTSYHLLPPPPISKLLIYTSVIIRVFISNTTIHCVLSNAIILGLPHSYTV